MTVLAADAIAVLDALRIKSAVVVGHCMGGFVAQWTATLAPRPVSKLALIGSAASANNRVVQSLAREISSFTDPVDLEFIRAFQMSTLRRPVPTEFLEKVIAQAPSCRHTCGGPSLPTC